MGCITISTCLDCYRKPFLFAQPPKILRRITQVPRSWILFLEIFRLSPGLYWSQTWPSVSTATASQHDSTTRQHGTRDRDQCSTAIDSTAWSQPHSITATQDLILRMYSIHTYTDPAQQTGAAATDAWSRPDRNRIPSQIQTHDLTPHTNVLLTKLLRQCNDNIYVRNK